MRPLPTLLLTALTLSACATGMRDTRPASADQEGVADLVAAQDAAWNAHDPIAHADLFAEDGTLVMPTGKRVEGRDALIEIFGSPGPTKQTKSSTTIDSVQWLDEGLVLIDATQRLSGPGAAVVGDTAHVVGVAALIDGNWRFVAVRPYELSERPQ